MKKEFGKYILDISKYTVTSVLISALFTQWQDNWVYALGGIVAALFLAIGLILVKDKELKKKGAKKR